MKVRFWGVRGSIPTPLTSEQLRGRIAAVVSRIRPEDLRSPESRETFLAGLPPYLFGVVGGNTTCLSIETGEPHLVVVDAGSGIRELASHLARTGSPIRDFHIFFTHFHWDHVQGLPFFAPAGYNPNCTLHFYSVREDLPQILQGQMKPPYFPVGIDAMGARKRYLKLQGRNLRLGELEIRWKTVTHPGSCVSYKITHHGRSLIFSTDTELSPKDFEKSPENKGFYQGAEVLVLDSQYTLGEAIEKYDWGHTSYSMAVDFAAEWDIKTLVLFHHEPQYNDRKIYSMLNSADWYRERLERKGFRVVLAVEGLELEI
ncbi:MAG: MBL fold metallo-hydrolase [Spirochaetales bacterium]|nr:MBL fold metallo-hydrolase [Spirochaetales bacterium]